MDALPRLASRLRAELPGLTVEPTPTGLNLRRGGAKVTLRQGDDINTFSASDRRARQRARRPYLDLSTGSLYVETPGLLLFLRLGELAPARLSPYQCALLALLLEHEDGTWFEREGRRPQVELARLLRLDFGVDVSPMNLSRFLVALTERNIMSEEGTLKLDRRAALGALRDDFRPSALGKAYRFAGDPADVEASLEPLGVQSFARGIAEVLARETGALVEPKDYIVERGELPGIRAQLGPPVPSDYRGAQVLIRAAQRVPLALLNLGRGTLQPLLAIVAGLQSDSPVARSAAEEALERRLKAWI
jgi:hypothetical protein